jgi:hypothetical protein
MTVLLAAVACAALVQAGAELVLRGQEPAPSGGVVEVSVDGVVVASAVTAPVVIGWDRVREVSGEHAEEAAAFAELADMAWRARIRLERGDVPAAEPLFERLFVTYQHRAGPTAATVCEGLLRCRLRRNAHTLAVGAWLAWLHARSADSGPQWYQRRGAPPEGGGFRIDGATGLLPDLPPIWIDLPAVRAFAKTPLESSGLGAREQELAALYVHAARLAGGGDAPLPRVSSADPGVRLVEDIVAAQGASEEERVAGRRAIEARLRAEPTGWEDAWLRTAMGRSLLTHTQPEERQRGIIELLRVRVLHERDCPYMAGLALAHAAVAVLNAGDAAGATVLRRELLDRFPGHPAASWDRIIMWPEEGAGGEAAGAPSAPDHEVESRTANG